MQNSQVTIETKIEDAKLYPLLERYSGFYTDLEMKLFNDLANATAIDNALRNNLKSQYGSTYKMQVRIFNALWSEVKGKIDSLKELHKEDIKDIECKIKSKTKDVNKFEKWVKTGKKGKKVLKPHEILELKAKIHNIKKKLNKLDGRLNRPFKLRMVFGSKNFYKQQWTAYENKHDEWLGIWRNARRNHFFFIGSKDESNGNQLCQYDAVKKHIEITMPPCFKMSKKLIVPVDFSSDNARRQKQYFDYFHQAIANGQALSYRFLKRDNGCWYVQCSFDLESEPIKAYNGVIGVDFNHGDIVSASLDRFGNKVGFEHCRFDLEDKTTEQVEIITERIVNDLVAKAIKENRSIVIEKLDLKKCKSGFNKKSNRKVSQMQYADFGKKLLVKCVKEKVELIQVHPAYTSVIGDWKYSKFYGVDRHVSAAIVIGRRGLGFKDRLTQPVIQVLQWGEGGKFEKVFRLGSCWEHWRFVSQNLGDSLRKLNSIQGNTLDENMLKSRFNPGFCVVGGLKSYIGDDFLTGDILKSDA